MLSHDPDALWRYAAGELGDEATVLLEHHLTDCPECREALEAARTARLTLSRASEVSPGALGVDWSKVEAGLDVKLGRAGRRRSPWPWAASAVAACAAAVLLWMTVRSPSSPLPTPSSPSPGASTEVARAPAPGASSEKSGALEPTPAPVPEADFQAERDELRVAEATRAPGARPSPSSREAGTARPGPRTRVARTVGAVSLRGQEGGPLVAGERLDEGDLLETGADGRVELELPEQSRLFLQGRAQVQLVQARPEDVELKVERGAVVVKASHAARKAFRVEAAGLVVRVVGTVFSVTAGEREVEVAVAEGRVRLEPPRGAPLFVSTGERLRLDRQRWAPKRSGLEAPQRALFEGVGHALSRTASGGLGAVVARRADGARLDDEEERPSANPVPELELPAQPSSVVAAGVAERRLPHDIEGIFLLRAEESLPAGRCGRFLLGLGEVLESSEQRERRAQARILRARCFHELLETERAVREYRLYLQEFPAGEHAREAQAALD